MSCKSRRHAGRRAQDFHWLSCICLTLSRVHSHTGVEKPSSWLYFQSIPRVNYMNNKKGRRRVVDLGFNFVYLMKDKYKLQLKKGMNFIQFLNPLLPWCQAPKSDQATGIQKLNYYQFVQYMPDFNRFWHLRMKINR